MYTGINYSSHYINVSDIYFIVTNMSDTPTRIPHRLMKTWAPARRNVMVNIQ